MELDRDRHGSLNNHRVKMEVLKTSTYDCLLPQHPALCTVWHEAVSHASSALADMLVLFKLRPALPIAGFCRQDVLLACVTSTSVSTLNLSHYTELRLIHGVF